MEEGVTIGPLVERGRGRQGRATRCDDAVGHGGPTVLCGGANG